MPSRNPWFGPWSDQFIFVSLIAHSNISVNITWQHKAPCLDANMSDYFHKSLVMLPACLLPCHIFIHILKLGSPSLTTWLYYAPPFTIAKLKNITPKPMVNGTYNILYLLIVNKRINCVFLFSNKHHWARHVTRLITSMHSFAAAAPSSSGAGTCWVTVGWTCRCALDAAEVDKRRSR